MDPTHASPPRRPTGWLRRWGAAALYCVLIFGLSSITAVPSLAAAVSDKLLHVLLYSGLGFLAARGRTDAAARPMSPADGGLVVGFSAAYALSDELHQLVVPGRQFDTGDLVADVAGATLGAGAWWLWGILRRIRHA